MLLLQDGDVIHHLIEVRDALGNGLALGGDVHIVEAVVIKLEFVHEFESEIGFLAIHRKGVGGEAEALVDSARTEHIHTLCVDGVPVAHGEFEMFAHGLAHHEFIGIVVLERERVFGLGVVFDFFDFTILFHSYLTLRFLDLFAFRRSASDFRHTNPSRARR